MTEVKGYIAVTQRDKDNFIKEEFKGEVIDQPVRFPKDLGADHPFSFQDLEKSFKRIGLVNGIVNKIRNAIVGDFQVKAKNKNIQAFLDDFIHSTNFPSVLREWIKEGLLKGNGFIEIDLQNAKVRVLNANNMYVRRNRKGKILEYNQWLGKSLTTFNRNSKLLTTFKPDQIAHLKINKISNEAYAIGIIWPNEKLIENMINMEVDLHKLMKRKAGMPIHVKIGEPGQSVQKEDIDEMSNLLKFMQNKTEWVTDANTEMKLIDFGGIGDNLTSTLKFDKENLSTGTNIPLVLMGVANIPEGLAKAQSEDYERFIRSIREEIEAIIEEQIFKPILLNQKFPDEDAEGLDDKAVGAQQNVEFIWNLPGEEEINKRIEKITALLGSFGISENMKRMLQLELARLMDFDEAERFLLQPESGLDQAEKDKEDEFRDASLDKSKSPKDKPSESPEAKEESQIKQPEVPGAKPGAKAKINDLTQENDRAKSLETDKNTQITHKNTCAKSINQKGVMCGCGCGQQLTESESKNLTIKEFVSLQEIEGFNYSDYLVRILRRLRVDKFEDLSALTEQDLVDGLLSERNINKLRIILKEGFRKNRTIAEIQREIEENIPLKDRLKEGKITAKAETRPNMISRTETVRIANLGLLDTYNENNVKKVRFLAALSERTCPQCEAMNGQVFMLNEASGIIPVHTSCRCTWLSVLD